MPRLGNQSELRNESCEFMSSDISVFIWAYSVTGDVALQDMSVKHGDNSFYSCLLSDLAPEL